MQYGSEEEVSTLFYEGWRCGWADLTLMKNFPLNDRCIAALDEAGFRVYVMESSDCAVFKDGQVLFNPETAVCIHDHGPAEFFVGYDWEDSQHVFKEYAIEFF